MRSRKTNEIIWDKALLLVLAEPYQCLYRKIDILLHVVKLFLRY